MPQFRKDPFGHAWVLISPERGLQTSEFARVAVTDATSPLSPENGQLMSEVYALRPATATPDSTDWLIRVVEHPGGLLQNRPVHYAGTAPFEYSASAGFQEIIIEHPDARERLETMPREHLAKVLAVYRERLMLLAQREGVKHVQLSRSVGKVAGSSFEHPHAQVLAVPVPSRWLEEEVAVARTHHQRTGRCLFCEVVEAEIENRERLVTQNGEFAAIAPYASKKPFETWIIPRRHTSAFSSDTDESLSALAEIIQTVLRGLNSALDFPPYNMVLHTLPVVDSAFHWHFEILPRLTYHSGFDWGSGYHVNPTAPEDAARFLREALALEGVSG